MTVDEAIETLRYEIDEECHCDYIADEIRLLIKTVEDLRFENRENKRNFIDELEYSILHEDIEIAEHKCKDYESYVNGANQFRHQMKNLVRKAVRGDVEPVTKHH